MKKAPGGSYMSAGRGTSGFGAVRRFCFCRVYTVGTMLQLNAVQHSAHAVSGKVTAERMWSCR